MKNKLFKNIRRQVYAKKSTAGSILIAMLIIIVSISTFLIVFPERVEAASYSDFGSYTEITIESDLIDAALSNFPLMVHDNTGDLSDILVNGSDIAFFNSARDTQFNHEIEWYNSTSGELWAWVNVTTVSDSVDTIFYMYYDDSDGGYPVGHNPESVWDGSYRGVWHMNSSTATVYDSIGANDGSKKAAAEPSQATGKIAYCQEYDGLDDYVDMGYDISLRTSTMTIEAWVSTNNYNSSSNTQEITTKDDEWYFMIDSAENYKFVFNPHAASPKAMSDIYPSNNTWYYVVGVYDGTDSRLYVNGTEEDNQTNDAPPQDGHDFIIGAHGDGIDGGTPGSAFWNGTIDEVRYSEIARNASWLKACFHNQNETTGFLTLGAEQEESSSFEIKGLTSNRVTWAGAAGTTVWCNSSGDGNEWLEINMSINATDNITEIRVWVGDLNIAGSAAYINASNITMYVSSDNSSYGEMGSFTDGGSNCSKHINTTNWNAGTMGADPFAGAGLTNDSFEIYLIFKLTIPAGSPTDIFWSAASDSFKIYIGIE